MTYKKFVNPGHQVAVPAQIAVDENAFNHMALRDAVTLGSMAGWSYSWATGTAAQPGIILFTNSSTNEVLKGVLTWTGTNVTTAVYSYSSDGGANYDQISSNTITFDGSGNLSAGAVGVWAFMISLLAKSNSALSFIQSGTGAVIRTTLSKLRERVTPQDFGAVGDGVTDDTVAIQAAIDAHQKIDLGGSSNTYKITSELVIPSNRTLYGAGATIDMRSISSGNLNAIRSSGSLGSSTSIGGASEGVYTVTLSDTSGISSGDYVQIGSGDYYTYGGGSYNIAKGEIKQIRSVVANTSITFTTPLLDTYTTSPVVYRVNWNADIYVDGINILGSSTSARGESGIVLEYVNNFSVNNCSVTGQDHYNIQTASCINGIVVGNRITSTYYNGITGTLFYGIAIQDCSQWIEVCGNIGNRARHIVLTLSRASGQGFVGQPYFIDIHDNIGYDFESGGAGRSYAYEIHGSGRFINIHDNFADGCYAGIQIENAQDVSISNNKISNYAYAGVYLGGSGTTFSNVLIHGNTIRRYTGEVTGSPAAIRVDAMSATLTNIVINGNLCSQCWNSTASQGVGISFGANTYVDVEASGNQVDAGADANTYGFVIASGSDGIALLGNTSYKYRGGFSISSSKCIVKNNKVHNSSAAATGFAYYSNGDRNVFQGNTAQLIASAFRADTASTNNLFVNNQAIQCTTGTFSNAGTANTGRDNDAI